MEPAILPEKLNPMQRVAVLVNWMKGLSVVPGTALDGAEAAGRVASHNGHLHLAPAWVAEWDRANRPLHGIAEPPAPATTPNASHKPADDLDSPEVKAVVNLMDPLETRLRENGSITDGESDLFIECIWALHDWNHDKAVMLLEILDRLLKEKSGKRK